jgi:hypothetical protein
MPVRAACDARPLNCVPKPPARTVRGAIIVPEGALFHIISGRAVKPRVKRQHGDFRVFRVGMMDRLGKWLTKWLTNQVEPGGSNSDTICLNTL